MKDPIMFRREDSLSPMEARYWKDLFYRVTKIGTELEVAPPKGVRRPDFQEGVTTDLNPSGTLELLGQNGVLDVDKEHCGVEIRIIGRQPHFSALYAQYASIMNTLKAHGARVRPTCGLHFHLLTPALAEPVPEIIMANVWNLTRRYAPELKFITSGGDKRGALTRRRNHNSHLEMVRHTPGNNHMQQIQKILKESYKVPEHQNFLNLEHLGFTEDGRILPFHLEFRFPDVDLSPTSVTAKTFLLLALLLKSVDLSQYGVIHVGKIEPWRRKIAILNMLNNNDGSLATSDTSRITDDVIEEIRVGCHELLDLLAPVFSRFDDDSALDVLLYLAEMPISLMRCAGQTWDEIEHILSERASAVNEGFDETDRTLMKRIELGEWSGYPSIEAWQWRAARELGLAPHDLERRLQMVQNLRGLRWDAGKGTLVFTS